MPSLLPNAEQQFIDANGKPYGGGKVYFYIPNTTTFKNTWQDPGETTLNTNPVVLDAAGRAVIYGAGQYRQQLYDVNNNLVWDQLTSDVGFAVSSFYTVLNIAALRAFSHVNSSYVSTLGYYVQGDQGSGNYYYDASDTTSADNGGTIIVASDGARWKLIVAGAASVRQFGAKGDGVTDDTAAINAAVAACATASIATFVPPGNYSVSSLTTLPANTKLLGLSEHITTITSSSLTADLVPVAAGNVKIDRIGFNASVTKTAGVFVRAMTGASDFKLSNFRMQNPFIGFSVEEGVAIAKIRDGYITGVAVLGSGGKIGTASTATGAFAVDVSGVTINCNNATNSNGILVTNVADLILTNMQLLNSPRNLLLQPNTGQAIASMKVVSSYIDTSSGVSMAFSPVGSGTINKVDFTGVWFQGGTSNCILIDGGAGSAVIDGVSFSNCEAYNSTSGAGLSIVGNSRNVSWIGGKIAANVYGVYISTNTGFNDISVKGARIGPIAPYAGNTTGINLSGQSDYNYINDNDLTGNTTSLTNGNISTHNRITGNAGYNDSPTMTTISPGASPYTLPVFQFPTVLFINAGTISLINVNGANVLQQGNTAIYRPPNSSMVITYSSAPTLVSVAA